MDEDAGYRLSYQGDFPALAGTSLGKRELLSTVWDLVRSSLLTVFT